MTSATSTEATGFGDRLLSGIERLGNKLPQPFNLFLILFLITAVVSTIMAWLNVSVTVPGAEEDTVIRGLFTGEGLAWLTTTLGENYIGFPPLVTVLPILLAIGIAEKTGFLGAAIRALVGAAPRWALPYVVGTIGVAGSIMSDAAFVVIPPLAAMAFNAVGRHPVAGLLGGFAAAGAGYSTNYFPTSLDALFAGITTAVVPTVPALEANASAITPVSNWFFNIVAALVLSVLAGFIIDRVIEPRMNRLGVPAEESRDDDVDDEDGRGLTSTDATRVIGDEQTVSEASTAPAAAAALTQREKAALIRGGAAVAITAAIMLIAVLIPQSPWRNEDGTFLPGSPLLGSIVFIIFTLFAVGGYVYGRSAGTIERFRDVPLLMGAAIRDMTSFLVLAFILGQFIALFNWSGIGSWIAVTGANGLESIGLTGFPAILVFILLCSMLNLFIISGSSMWTLMAAVFVPMFGLIGYDPTFVQAAFRVGDSATQVITPLNPYMIVMLTFLRRYEPDAGLGTLIARMLPFVVPFWIAWVIVLFVFFSFDLPLGPGSQIFLPEGSLD